MRALTSLARLPRDVYPQEATATSRVGDVGCALLIDGLAQWVPEDDERVEEQTVGGLLRWAAARAPDEVALVAGTPDPAQRRRWTFGELLAESEQVARALARRFGPGERVAVWAGNIPEWVVLEFGAALAGLTLVTVNPALRLSEARHVLSDSQAAGVFLVREYRGVSLERLAVNVQFEAPGLREILFFDQWDEFLRGGSLEPAADGALLPEVRPGHLSINALLSSDVDSAVEALLPPVLEPPVYDGPERRLGIERRTILEPRPHERRVFGRRATDLPPVGSHWGIK